jgi:hypothetical protein
VTSPAQQLVELAHEELGLVASGRVDELKALQDRRDAALSALDERALSSGDRAALVQAHALQVQITALLEKATAETAGQLARLDRGRAGVRGYATSTKRAA